MIWLKRPATTPIKASPTNIQVKALSLMYAVDEDLRRETLNPPVAAPVNHLFCYPKAVQNHIRIYECPTIFGTRRALTARQAITTLARPKP